MEMGKLKADDVPVIVMDHPAVKALSGFFEKPIEGIIGYTFWARFRMSIDYKDLQLTFEPVDFQVRDLMKELPQRLAGPKVAKTIILAPRGIWGIELGEHQGRRDPRGADRGRPARLGGRDGGIEIRRHPHQSRRPMDHHLRRHVRRRRLGRARQAGHGRRHPRRPGRDAHRHAEGRALRADSVAVPGGEAAIGRRHPRMPRPWP